MDRLQTSVKRTAVNLGDFGVFDLGESNCQLVGLLDAIRGERGIGGDVGGRWDVGIVGSGGGIEGPVDSKLDQWEAISASDRSPVPDLFAAKMRYVLVHLIPGFREEI